MGTLTFSDFYESQYVPLVRLASATTLSRALAEELVQDAFASAYERWTDLTNPSAWIRRTVVNLSASWVRRQRVERSGLRRSAGTLRDAVGPDEARGADVMRALRALPVKQRAVVFLVYYEDLSEQQVADTLGCAVGTVKSRLNRARNVLKEQLS